MNIKEFFEERLRSLKYILNRAYSDKLFIIFIAFIIFIFVCMAIFAYNT